MLLPGGPLALIGGRVLDPTTGAASDADVVTDGWVITAIGPGAAGALPSRAERIDVSGALVVPGLIDLAAHVAAGLGDLAVDTDLVGVQQAVTTVVDAGTSGVASFPIVALSLRGLVVLTSCLAWVDARRLHIGTVDDLSGRLGIGSGTANLDAGALAAVLDHHRDVAVGVHVSASDLDAVAIAASAAEARPLLARTGAGPLDAAPRPVRALDAAVLRLLRPGDVLSGAFGPAPLSDGLVADLAAATRAGILLDAGGGPGAFAFATARRLLDAGAIPALVTSGLSAPGLRAGAPSLAGTATRLLALGLGLPDVIRLVTTGPAAVLAATAARTVLAPGHPADASVLRARLGPIDVTDGQETVRSPLVLEPVGCLRSGVWFAAATGGSRP